MNVEIDVFLIGKTEVAAGMDAWLARMAPDYRYDQNDLTGAEAVIGHAAKRCYLSFEPGLNPNVTRVRKNWYDYFENVLASRHGSVLEHATYSFAIEGVSRVFTAEMNRHRAGVAISEGSLRYIRFEDAIPYWIPESIRDEAVISPDVEDTILEDLIFRCQDKHSKRLMDLDNLSIEGKKQLTRRIFELAFEDAEIYYRMLCEVWDIESIAEFSEKKVLTSLFRRIVPLGVATGGVWTMNIRALRHIIALRATEHSEEEIALVASMMGKLMVENEPRLFCDFERVDGLYWVPKYDKV